MPQRPVPRPPLRKSAPRGAAAINPNRPKVVAAAALLAIVMVWALWPSPLAKVINLRSRGSAIIAFGDSLTAGYGANPVEAYPSRLAVLIGEEVLNAGVSGDTTEAARERLERDVLPVDPRMVIVGLGGNDFLRGVPIAATETNLRAIIRKIQAGGAMVVILGYRFPSITSNYEAMYSRVAKEEGALQIPDLLDGITSNPELKSDEIHPNARGYQLMAERVAGPVKKLIRKANSSR